MAIMWYNYSCLGERNTGRFAFGKAVTVTILNIVGKAPLMCGLASRCSPRQRRQAHKGRFVMSNKSTRMAICKRCSRYSPVAQDKTICNRCEKELIPKTRKLSLEVIDQDQLALITPKGYILPKEEWTDLKRRIDKFYQYKSYEAIEKINRELALRLEEGKLAEESGIFDAYIYLIRADKYYKIGLSKQVTYRFDQISTSLPFPTTLIHHFQCQQTSKVEVALHALFGSKRLHGEWFILSSEDVKWFSTLDGENIYQKIKQASLEAILEKERKTT